MQPHTATEQIAISEMPVWEQARKDRVLLSVVLDLTARCNNDCCHCYINLPADDPAAKTRELTLDEIKTIIDQSVSLGALWFVLSGGEPLLRPDFSDIYVYLKKKGLLVSVFTNASLITDEHIKLFKKYPPRDIEVTVYGTTPQVHKKVTGKKTFAATMNGIDLLLSASLPVTLKTTLMKYNISQLDKISDFCRSKSDLPFRFDPFLQLRLDKNPVKNETIRSQRLTPDEIIRIEKNDPQRYQALKQKCKTMALEPSDKTQPLFKCQAGINSCAIGFDGTYKLCPSLSNNHCTLDLKKDTLDHAWNTFTPMVLNIMPTDPVYKKTCGACTRHDICSWCPAHADLETNRLDGHVQYFCDIAEKRHRMI
ncbi:MAG: radical SAM protein [Proteobacteria bacterium]|nr:radical SAM protein [Pseudomonadota bacterium]MBU1585270.1 radical SAM protein [Pseudomonadota bacterium]MBU2455514.1 radical SAM protein [Pseudomonadota bacterium]MBU2626986.1 radical SAM protein [Pseudomonadota bacterium]